MYRVELNNKEKLDQFDRYEKWNVDSDFFIFYLDFCNQYRIIKKSEIFSIEKYKS